MRNLTDVAAIAGVGETEYVRGTKKSERQLIMEASARAAADAGIRPREIDGLVMAMKRDRPTNEDFVQALGIRDLKFHAHSHIGGASAAAGVTLAAAVVATGMAENVLVATGWTAFSGPVRLGSVSNELATGDPAIPSADIRRNIDAPVGLNVPMQLYSLHANRYFYETGSSRDGLREIALTTRRHANLKPNAYMRDRPMSAEDYDSSPMVVDPFHLYDICLETDGAGAVIVSRASNVTRANRHREVVYIGGGAEGHPDTPFDLASRGDITNMGVSKAAPRALDMAGITLDDVDFVEIYDCFTFIVLRQLEEIGFCGRGEGSDFVAGGRIGLHGDLPLNTHGGLLSQAHIAGMNHIIEAVHQLRGDADGAKLTNPRVGLVTGYGDLGDGSLVVLHV